ncbi:hypothetical protein ACWEQA_23690 [Nocardia sp. NPDC004085]
MLDAPTRYSVAYETATRACYPDQVKADLADAGFEVVAHLGIRTVCDYILDDDRKSGPEFYRQLERLELALAARPLHLCGPVLPLHRQAVSTTVTVPSPEAGRSPDDNVGWATRRRGRDR